MGIKIQGLKEIIYCIFVKMVDMVTSYWNKDAGTYAFCKYFLTLQIYLHLWIKF